MDKYIFSQEEINEILLNSPMALPDNPSDIGLKGKQIKSFFYVFIRQLINKLNERYSLIESDREREIELHSESAEAHRDIRSVLSDLDERDRELGNAISEHREEILALFESEGEETDRKISSHNGSYLAHPQIREQVLEIRDVAQNALSFAQGKSRIIPVKGIYEMTTKLRSELNVGDKFILSDKNVPDFTLFEKNSANESATVFTQADLLTGAVNFEPGQSYLYEGYLLVASESGLDTSLFAKKEDVTRIESVLTYLDEAFYQIAADFGRRLETREVKIVRVVETSSNVTLKDKTEHSLGLCTAVNLLLPESIPEELECIVNFRSGETPTSFTCDSRIIMTQDDCYKGVLTPCKNRIYEINVKNVDGILIAKVGSCDI